MKVSALLEDDGYIRLHRKSLRSQVFKDEYLWRLWSWCLMKASYTERWVSFKSGKGNIQVKLSPGQFIFGRESAAKELQWNGSSIWKRMQKLKTIGNCDIESNSQYSVITVANWDTYQNMNNKSDSASDSQVTAKGQPSNTNNKDKKEKNVKKKEYSVDFLTFWNAYPVKVDKPYAYQCWRKANGKRPLIDIILTAIQAQKEWRENANGEFRPEWKNPATWLNKGSWEDECAVKDQWEALHQWAKEEDLKNANG